MENLCICPREFEALSVFAGSFTLDAARAVIAAACPAGDALPILERLVDHSLFSVIYGHPRRCRLLETISTAGPPRGRTGHAAWVVESVAGLLGDLPAAYAAGRLMAAAHQGRPP